MNSKTFFHLVSLEGHFSAAECTSQRMTKFHNPPNYLITLNSGHRPQSSVSCASAHLQSKPCQYLSSLTRDLNIPCSLQTVCLWSLYYNCETTFHNKNVSSKFKITNNWRQIPAQKTLICFENFGHTLLTSVVFYFFCWLPWVVVRNSRWGMSYYSLRQMKCSTFLWVWAQQILNNSH